jgi:AraC family transcriptional regulator of adaptative response/methylated-DNA-[protein]-cysteine methyltransferase
VAKACRLIATAPEPPDLNTLAAAAALSAYHFHRVFRKVTGLTPKAYAAAHRAGRLRTELARTRTITDAAYAAGFNSSGGFYANARTTLGMSAKVFRKAGEGERVSFALAHSALGWVLVAATAKGICEIALGDERQALIDDLKRRFSNATLNRDRAFGDVLAKVVAHIEMPERPFELPLDLRGTVFQQRVWHALREIPPGTSISYKELAARLDAPTSVRAVARACASNTVAIAVPCHRVVRSDGTLAGYRWGIERKRVMLERERIKHRKAGK